MNNMGDVTHPAPMNRDTPLIRGELQKISSREEVKKSPLKRGVDFRQKIRGV